MKRQTTQRPILAIKIFIMVILTGAALSLLLASFTVPNKMADDFLKQLGISKTNADSKITNSLLNGSLDAYGIKNIKNIALGNRTAITKDLLVYTKQYLGSAAFINEYNAMREKNKPVMPVLQTPEEMQKGLIESGKKSVAELEEKVKRADGSMKGTFEKILESARKQLQQAEDPNNKSIAGYRKGYPNMVKGQEANYQRWIAEWETKYPANHLLFVKQRLQQFLDETKDVDFSAELYEKKGIKYFTNPAYERKSDRWKMVFRAGAAVVEPARSFVQEWILSIK
jgi:hypothetical protein